jgi:hypothetical protein
MVLTIFLNSFQMTDQFAFHWLLRRRRSGSAVFLVVVAGSADSAGALDSC